MENSCTPADGSPETSADALFLARAVPVMRIARLIAPLIWTAVALTQLLSRSIPTAVFCLAAALLGTVAVFWTEHAAAAHLGIDRRTLTALEFRVYFGSGRTNGLHLPPLLRILPAVFGVGAAILLLAFGVGHLFTETDGLAACLCASLVSGISVAAPLAAVHAAEVLRRRDITVEQFLSLPQLSRIRTLLADQTVFYGTKSAELRAFFADGMLRPVAELDFEEHLPLVLGFCRCDDGSLAAACGLRQSFSDALLHAMRKTPMEYRSYLTPIPTVFTPWHRETGVVAASLTLPDGSALAYRAGKPESILPQATRIMDHGMARLINDTDRNRIAAAMHRAHELGRQAVALASSSDGLVWTMVGLLILHIAPDPEASSAVRSLRQNGIQVVYVSREEETCAFFRASELGITNDMSRVITGARMDRFHPENLERVAGRARVAADMDDAHRQAFFPLLTHQGSVIAAASDDPDDPLFDGADIRFSSGSGHSGQPDVSSRGCRIVDIAETCRVCRAACDAAARAMYAMLAVPLAVALFVFLASFSASLPPFSVPAAVLLSCLLPLPFGFLTARYGAPLAAPASPLALTPSRTPLESAGHRLSGRFFPGFCITVSGCTALYTARLYARLSPVTNAGALAASSAAFLTLLTASVVLLMIAYHWGNTLFSLWERRHRPIFCLAVLVCAAAYALSRWEPFNALFGFSTLSLRVLPQTVLPALAAAVVYELGLIVARLLKHPTQAATGGYSLD